MSQQRFSPNTVTQARPGSHTASDVHASRQFVVSAQTGAPDTSGRQTVRLPLQSDGPHGVPAGDGEQGINRPPMSAMKSLILLSVLVSLSPFGLKHPPFASALANAFRNAASALAMHSKLTVVPFRTAIAWQVSFASTFFLTALIFASAHFTARRDATETAAFAGAAPRITPTRTTIVNFMWASRPSVSADRRGLVV
jgi:hypothetical protein